MLRARSSASWTITPGDRAKRTTGLVLGVAGSAAFGVGLLLVAVSSMSQLPLHGGCAEAECEEKDKPPLYWGIGTMVVGAITAPIGWVMYANNRTRVAVEEYDSAAETLSKRFRIGVASDFKRSAAATVSVAF